MITHWNKICEQIEASDNMLSDFIENSGLSATQLKKLEKFTKEWNKAKKMAEEFDKFITPVEPIKIESPFDQDDFRYMWKMWKEYLLEQHGILMRSRMEQASLEYLAEISGSDPDLAISYIRFAMKGPYRSFFKVTESDKINPPKNNKDGSDF